MKRKIVLTALTLSVLSAFPVYAGQWQQNNTGYWYQNDDGSNPAAAWQNIDGKWYYFKSDGYMNTGWIKVSDQWYYCESSGEMRTADLPTDVMTFKFNADGSCSNFYENVTPSTQAGWANYGTTSLSTWADAILKGNIVYYNGQYWATPDYTSGLKNENVVYFHDIAMDNGQTTETTNRYGLADLDIDFSDDNDDQSLTGITTDDIDFDDWD